MATVNAPEQSTTPVPHRTRQIQSVADAVVEALEDRIRTEALPAGTHLGTKHDLCQEFAVAPATLGEALRVLRARELVEVRPGPGGGIFVAKQPPLIKLAHSVLKLRQRGATVNEVIGVLDALDEAVMRDATMHRKEKDLRDLDILVDELTLVWHDPHKGLHCNWRLHRRIAEITPNLVLRTFYQNLIDYIEGEMSSSEAVEVPGFRVDSEERLRIHVDLVEAIRSGDVETANEAIARHRSMTY